MNTLRLLLLIGLLTGSNFASAEPVGTAFTYQGELEQQNVLATGVYDFQFDLFDVEINGDALTSPFQLENIDVQDGIFTVELDFGSGVFDGTQLWLAVAVRDGASVAAYTPLIPRQKLTSSPYSIGKSAIVTGVSCGAGATLIGYQNDGALDCACLPGFSQCGESCPDLMNDPANCGICGNVCSSGSDCTQGVCRACNVITQSCTEPDEACFLNLSVDLTQCNAPFLENGDGMQGNDCSFVNGCAKGFGCVLLNSIDNVTGTECARFCDIDRSFPAPCETDAGAGFRCVRAAEFYSDFNESGIGFCVGPEWFP